VVNLLDHRIVGVPTDCVPYLLSKKMLAEFTRMAALELATSITVNGVAPGPVLAVDKRRNLAAREKAGDIPLARRPTPEDVAAAVVFLLESDSITGQTIFVDGGRHLIS
jgi:NAD(P)-dependent dehydrogenase (short-subunit alcohol dehydrogenase family)